MTLYTLPFWNNDLQEEKINMKTFVFLGKNWDFYFTKKVHVNAEKIEKCQLSKVSNKEKNIDYDEGQNLFLKAL